MSDTFITTDPENIETFEQADAWLEQAGAKPAFGDDACCAAALAADALRARGDIDPQTYAAVYGNPDYITDESLAGDLKLSDRERRILGVETRPPATAQERRNSRAKRALDALIRAEQDPGSRGYLIGTRDRVRAGQLQADEAWVTGLEISAGLRGVGAVLAEAPPEGKPTITERVNAGIDVDLEQEQRDWERHEARFDHDDPAERADAAYEREGDR